MRIRFYDIVPKPYVRQTQRDKWNPRDTVLHYRAFRDEVGHKRVRLFDDFTQIIFILPTFQSWSKKKIREHVGRPHLAKPDKDNLEKGLLDAIYRHTDDAHVWNTASAKVWGGLGGIVLSDTFIPVHHDIPLDLAALIGAARNDRISMIV